jgi:hypothetical protein
MMNWLKKEIYQVIPFMISTETKGKYLGINLTKELKIFLQ